MNGGRSGPEQSWGGKKEKIGILLRQILVRELEPNYIAPLYILYAKNVSPKRVKGGKKRKKETLVKGPSRRN